MNAVRPIRVAYADPPYPGCGALYSTPGTPEYHPDAMRWDDPSEHVRLMEQLERDYPDGWALSTNVGSLRALLRDAPPRALVASWIRGSMRMRREVSVLRGWEPVIYSVPVAPRCKGMFGAAIDHVAAFTNQHTTEGFVGAKPRAFGLWVCKLLGLGGHPDDEFVDLFPGSGAVTRAWQDYRATAIALRSGGTQGSLFA